MKILLINAPLEKKEIYKSFSPPLGLLYIAAVLEKNGFEVEVIDGNHENNYMEVISSRIIEFNPEYIGISAMTPTFPSAVKIADIAKKIKPESIVVMGGYHPTFFAEQILRKYPFVDIVVKGEGEYSLLYIVEGKELCEIPGIVYRKNGEVTNNGESPQIVNLDNLPFPARHLVKKYKYEFAASFVWYDLRKYRMSELKRYTSISTSRGCPFRCTYCGNTAMMRNKFRARSADNVIKEIEFLVKEGNDRFYFVDDNFTASPERAKKICQAIKQLNAKIKWFCMGRVDTASDELYKQMAESGCILIYYGVESGSQRILDYYNKNTNTLQIRNAITLAKKYGIDVLASIIVGAPIETDDDVNETKKILTELDIDFVEANKLTFLPGTPLWNNAVSEGRISEKDWERFYFVNELYENISFSKLRGWGKQINSGFYLRPSYIIKQIWRAFSKKWSFNS